MTDEMPTTPPLAVVTPKVEPKPIPKEEKPAKEEKPFRHATCADCERPILDDQPAVVYPYAKVSYHTPHRPAQDPPMPVAPDEAEA